MARRELGLVIGYATSLVGGVLSLVLYAHLLGPAEYGRLAVNLALVEALQGVLFQWHRLAVVRFWASSERTDIASYLTTYHLTWLGMTCLVLLALGVAQIVAPGMRAVIWPATIAMGIGKSAALYAQELARAAGASLRYSIGALCITIGSSVAAVAAYNITHSILSILLSSTFVFAASAALCGLHAGLLAAGGRFSSQYFRSMLHYGAPLVPVFVATTALTRLDRPVLAEFVAPTVVGVYAATTALISNVISAGCLLVVTPAYPWLLRQKECRPEDNYRRLHARMGLLMLGGVLAISTSFYCARLTILPILLGNEIGGAASSYVLPLLAISIVGAFRAHFLDQAYHLFSRTRALMTINLGTLVVAAIAVYVGARWNGLNGLLCGLFIANVLSLLASAGFSRSFVNLKQLTDGVVRLALVSAISGIAGELSGQLWTLSRPHSSLTGIASASVAIFIFAVGMYSTNVGAIRSFSLRRS
jgi:O-antigen/teichoic acid export membrane protein